jgi:hypothetical protein
VATSIAQERAPSHLNRRLCLFYTFVIFQFCSCKIVFDLTVVNFEATS